MCLIDQNVSMSFLCVKDTISSTTKKFPLSCFYQANLVGGEFLMCNVGKNVHPELPVHKHLYITKSSSENCYLLSRSGCCCKMKYCWVILSWQQSSSVNEKGSRAECFQRLLKCCHEVAKSSLQSSCSVLNALFSRIFQLEKKLISKFKSLSHNKTETVTVTHSKHFNVSLFYRKRQVPAEDRPFLIPQSQI